MQVGVISVGIVGLASVSRTLFPDLPNIRLSMVMKNSDYD